MLIPGRMMKGESNGNIIEEAVHYFKYVANNIASHINVRDENIYPQPSTYLTTHYICMKVAGFREFDFDTLTAVSGASALFSYFPLDFMPKYAHLHIGISKRIEQATGFGWEWLKPCTPEECFEIIRESIDNGIPLTGTYYEDLLFTGYSDLEGKRKVYVMTDGAEYFTRWFSWKDFIKWFDNWGDSGLGRFAGQKKTLPDQEIAMRFIRDLVNWSVEPPRRVVEEYPGAKFGLEGISQYAQDCGDISRFSDWRACHEINPQWITRRSTAMYLDRLAETDILGNESKNTLMSSSGRFQEAYGHWREFYTLLGHGAPEKNGRTRTIRLKGAAAVNRALHSEREALSELSAIPETCGWEAAAGSGLKNKSPGNQSSNIAW